MKNIITKICQSLADKIIKNVQESNTDFEYEFWISQGLNLDDFCIRRDIYLNRHLCLKSNNEVFLIVKKSDIINNRANSFINVVNNYYSSSMIFENHGYKLIKFSKFNSMFCSQ